MKIITAAKQNMTQDPELLSEVCQQTLLKETEWTGMTPQGLFNLNVPPPPVQVHIPAV